MDESRVNGVADLLIAFHISSCMNPFSGNFLKQLLMAFAKVLKRQRASSITLI